MRRNHLLFSIFSRVSKPAYLDSHILFVHPSFQNCGVGSALIRECIDLADSDHTPMLLEASEAGLPLYTKRGFEQVDELRFTYKGEEIVIPCMIRQPSP